MRKYEEDKEYRKAFDELELPFKIAKNIIMLRKLKGMTQTDLAKMIHTKQSVISRIEQANHNVTIKKLEEIAVALDTSVEILITKEIKPKGKEEEAGGLAQI
ncbi:helix-turn-helix domain-containing protein [Aureibacillus halotolerans]|uniref:Helix-turn-helix protein n=1 Tax=Aureibacillus halotolerans TaxID=1508390 RepID=A0A4R6U6W7_9BACI|nr:helix-turn-helix transcriptional regulator [Aureibacillus halotolerans]TDQ38784.1 helix-turn-helix protein [Aureibacillus halotolerans]